jgi:hypothetical protein
MNEFKTETHDVNGGIQKIYRFPNGYGASVIRHLGSYGYEKGLWVFAVLDGAGDLDYSTPITEDVLGGLNDPQVDNILGKISRL